jgi:hypothetical protein
VHNFDIECKDLFQTTKTSVEALNQLVAHELHFFGYYHVDVNSCKCALSWWRVEEHKFLIVALLDWQILGIPKS